VEIDIGIERDSPCSIVTVVGKLKVKSGSAWTCKTEAVEEEAR
jgi:hypothetical protein